MLGSKTIGPQFIMNSTPISINDSNDVKTSSTEDSFRKRQKNSLSSTNNIKSSDWMSKNLKQKFLPLGETPSGFDKVVNWMGRKSFGAVLDEDKNSLNSSNEQNEATFFRYDYKTSKDCNDGSLKKKDTLTSIFNKCVPLYTSLKSDLNKTEVKSDSKASKFQAFFNAGDNTDESNSIEHSSYNGDLHFSHSSAERKKELCNYLKLMNHADKKEKHFSQFRRSTRVKNLEKKELARKIQKERKDQRSSQSSEGVVEDKMDIFRKSITLKSFNELNMIIDTSKYPKLNIESSTTKFNFIMPPSDVLNEFNDFQYWINPLIAKQTKLGKIVPKHKKNGASLLNNETRNRKEVEVNPSIERLKVKKKFRDKRHSDIDENNPDKSKLQLNGAKNVCNDETEIVPSINESKRENYKLVSTSESPVFRYNRNKSNSNMNISNEKTMLWQSNAAEEKCDNILVNDVNLRVDYERNNIDSCEKRRKSRETEERIQTPLCNGFTEEDIVKSQEVLNKFKNTVFKCFKLHETSNNEIEKPFVEIIEEENMESDGDSSSDTVSLSESEESTSSSCESLSIENGRNKMICDNNLMVSPSEISPRTKETQPFDEKIEVHPLHSFLKKQQKRTQSLSCLNGSIQGWDSDNSSTSKNKCENSKFDSQHFISYDKKGNGEVQCAIYVDFYLLLVQEFAVSLWNQTALGNVLGAQNMWIFNGCTKKLILNKECMRKKSLEMVTSTDSCVVYIELWTKEHKSDFRQGPVADVFATVYFWIQKLNKMDKKVLQLENINGFADDVQYVVLKPSLNIVVSWHSLVDNNKVTLIRIYTLASDFQTISNVRALAKVGHYVSSLHNIEDCEELLMGCGEHRITLWNIEHGYIVATIELCDIKLSLCTLWAKCDRGILFTVQQCVDGELRLIAINGRSHSWKRLKSYKPSNGFERIQSVHIDNGVLISFYDEGILCWKAQTGEQIVEEIHNETDIEYFPSGKYLIMLTKKNVFIQHALTHLLAVDD